jgi:hypothetical protein
MGLKTEKKIIHCPIPIAFSYMDQLMLFILGLILVVLWPSVLPLQPMQGYMSFFSGFGLTMFNVWQIVSIKCVLLQINRFTFFS